MYKQYSSNTNGIFTGLIEVWKDVEDYEGSYQVSSFGRVKSLARMRVGRGGSLSPLKEKIMSPKVSKSGYLCIGLSKDSKKSHPSVHRLVAKAFIKEIEGKDTVNHIDGCKTNNNVKNLEWASHAEQMQHAVKMDLLEKRGTIKFTKAFKKEVLEFSKENTDFSIVALAKHFGLSERTAGRIVNEGVNRKIVAVKTNNGVVSKEVTSKQQVKEIKELRANGWILKDIADLYNLGTSQVWRICKNLSRDNDFEE